MLCSRIMQKPCCNKCVWYPKALCQTAHFCNKFQVKLFLFQWLGQVFLSSSSPKVGICSKRSNLHILSFLRFTPVLWIIDKHCNNLKNLLQTNTLATHQQYIRHYISLDFCSLFLIAKFQQEFNKRNKRGSNFWERTVFLKEMFW